MREEETRKTQITIFCKDNTKRVITSVGVYTVAMATALGRDLDGDNFKYAVVSIL